ncbi:MAG: hypothetical protein RL211_2270 [Pseudomonadota bacterium]
MGYQVKNVCYPTLELAKLNHCAQASYSYGSGTANYSYYCRSTAFAAANTTYAMCRSLNGGACVNTNIAYPTFQPCSYDGSNNNPLEYFGLFLAVFVIVIAAKTVLNIFRGRHEVA